MKKKDYFNLEWDHSNVQHMGLQELIARFEKRRQRKIVSDEGKSTDWMREGEGMGEGDTQWGEMR